MFLTSANLAHYLFFRGLLTSDSVVNGDFVVIEAGRRHRNFRLKQAGSRGLFIKQSPAATSDTAVTLQREATFYQILRDRPAFTHYARIAPHLVDYDPAAMTLIVELLPNCENLTEYHLRMGGFPEEIAQVVGAQMGSYHLSAKDIVRKPLNRALFPHLIPWIFLVDEGTLADSRFGVAGLQLSNLLRTYPGLLDQVRQLAPGWQFDCIVHGDLKWDNLLIGQADTGGLRFHVIDWELVDVGDASWDVASVLAAYLSFWLWSVDQLQQPPELFGPATDSKREQMKSALKAFWTSYATARGLAAGSANEYLERCVRYCAARLIAVMYEYLFNMPRVNNFLVTMLRVSNTLIADPGKAVQELISP